MKTKLLEEFIRFLGGQEETRFCTRYWQTGDVVPIRTLEQLHACGNKACIGGYLTLWPVFQDDGGYANATGAPEILGYSQSQAFAYFFEIPLSKAQLLLTGGSPTSNSVNPFRVDRWGAWTIADAVRALTLLCDYPELNALGLCNKINGL